MTPEHHEHDRPRHNQHEHGQHEHGQHEHGQPSRSHELRMYGRFAAMITTSTTVMFLLTYTNSYAADHVRFSEERVYMALLMGAAMAIIMLGFMWGMMYKNVRINVAIVLAALVLGVSSLWLSRSQAWVDDVAYMDGMIPHHSIAILTSERAQIEDVRVRELADEIIKAQRREIKEMDWLVADIIENGRATTPEEAAARPVPSFTGELNPGE